LVLTHGHFDHVGSARTLQEEWGSAGLGAPGRPSARSSSLPLPTGAKPGALPPPTSGIAAGLGFDGRRWGADRAGRTCGSHLRGR
jgi:glyoxylase-like metal-dependent hydrolase (beta-lactamase superfamily II)